jgi:ABC-type transport system substrate-binding protein
MIKKVGYFSLVIALVFLLLSIDEPEKGGRLTIGIPAGVGSLVPWGSFYGLRDKALANIYERLAENDWEKSLVKPRLALDWEGGEENRFFIIRLREGVRFHNGKSLTADDVVASASQFPDYIQFKAEKVDRMKVRFNLKRPASTFLAYLVQPECSIGTSSSVEHLALLIKKEENPRFRDFDKPIHPVRKRYLIRKDATSSFRAVGTGPFKLLSWEKDKELVLVANKDYWGEPPHLSRLVYRVFPDYEEMISALERGEIDFIDLVYPKSLDRLKKNKNLVIESTYGLNICYLAMNNKKPPFSDGRVRRAIGLSIDKLTLAKKFFYGGYGIPTDRPLSPAFFGFPTIPDVGEYDPRKAKKLLSEAGYPEGFSATLITVPFVRPYLPDPRGCAEEIKRELNRVGIKVAVVVPEDMNEYVDMVYSDDTDIVLSGWTSVPADPDFIMTPLLGSSLVRGRSGENISRFSSTFFDEKLFAARRLPLSDVWGRIKVYNEALKIFNQELPFIPLFHTRFIVVFNKKVRGVEPTPDGMVSFSRVWLKD